MPGGASRKTVVVQIGSQKYVVSQRRSKGRAALEAQALQRLEHTGLVPSLLHHNDEWIVQEFVEGQRLAFVLETGNASQRHELLVNAAMGLLELQQSGSASDLMAHAPDIGARPGWVDDFAKVPEHLAKSLGVDIGTYDPSLVTPFLRTDMRVFVKWDARPGNALLDKSGRIVWHDWEHCGRGAPEDDFVWFFADESAPIGNDAVRQAVKRAAGLYELEPKDVESRFLHKAVLHSLYRLQLILRKKGDGPWWSAREVLEKDRLGVTQAHVRRLCQRASQWANQTEACVPLVPLISHVFERTQ